jgi:hypothetical protein
MLKNSVPVLNASLRWLCLVILACPFAMAAQPVATVQSSKPFRLRGAPVPVAGVPSWPVAIGDDIETAASRAVISFPDGNRVTLATDSRAKLEKDAGRIALRLLKGSAEYDLPAASALRLYVLDKPAKMPSASRGFISLSGGSASPSGSQSILRKGNDNNDDDDNDEDNQPPVSKHGKGPKKAKNR